MEQLILSGSLILICIASLMLASKDKKLEKELESQAEQIRSLNQWKKKIVKKAVNKKKNNPVRSKSRDPIVK